MSAPNAQQQPPWKCPTVYFDNTTAQSGAPFKLNNTGQKKHYKQNLQKMLDAGTVYAFKEAGYNVDTSAFEIPMDTEGVEIKDTTSIVFKEEPSPWVNEKTEAGTILVRKIIYPEPPVPCETDMETVD